MAYTEEQIPSFGVIKDRVHQADAEYKNWYEFGTVNGPVFTLRTVSDKVAIMCLMLLQPANRLIIHRPRLALDAPIHLDLYGDQKFKELFGEYVTNFVEHYRDDIIAALQSILPGNIETRVAFNETLALLPENIHPEYTRRYKERRLGRLNQEDYTVQAKSLLRLLVEITDYKP